jgi:hypothetical protein
MVDGAPQGRPTGFLGALSCLSGFLPPAWRGAAAISGSSTHLKRRIDGAMANRARRSLTSVRTEDDRVEPMSVLNPMDKVQPPDAVYTVIPSTLSSVH